ncbi:MAG: tail fiber domain-containing protein [Balneolales bacterium]
MKSATQFANYGVYGDAQDGENFNAGIYGKHDGDELADNWGGYFNGKVYTTESYESSDERFKVNITAANGSQMLAKIGQLQPHQYQYLNPDELQLQGLPRLNFTRGTHHGFLVQEIETVFPELVIDTQTPLDWKGVPEEENSTMSTKAVNYTGLIPVLVAGMKEQQAQIEALEARIEALENQMQE